MKTILIVAGVATLFLIGGVWWSKSLSQADPNIIATRGLHWHPKLEMYLNGEKIDIPQNIGLGSVHLPMHTHDDLPLIHLEFGEKVTRDDVRLGVFFRNWGKDMRSFGDNMRMMVNGVESTEFENYEMKDGDLIQLYYE